MKKIILIALCLLCVIVTQIGCGSDTVQPPKPAVAKQRNLNEEGNNPY
jgi:hypothetical protein